MWVRRKHPGNHASSAGSRLSKNIFSPANVSGIFLLSRSLKQVTLIPILHMYWTLELAQHLEDAPWPATKDELIDYGIRSGAPLEVIENLQELEDEGEAYESIEEIWPDYPTKDDFFFNEDEY